MKHGYKIYKDKNDFVVVADGDIIARRKTETECKEIISELTKASEKATEQVNKILGVKQ